MGKRLVPLSGEALRSIGRYSHIGFMFGLLTVGGFFLGQWIDNRVGSFPVLSILLFLLGLSAAMYYFIYMVNQDRKKDR